MYVINILSCNSNYCICISKNILYIIPYGGPCQPWGWWCSSQSNMFTNSKPPGIDTYIGSLEKNNCGQISAKNSSSRLGRSLKPSTLPTARGYLALSSSVWSPWESWGTGCEIASGPIPIVISSDISCQTAKPLGPILQLNHWKYEQQHQCEISLGFVDTLCQWSSWSVVECDLVSLQLLQVLFLENSAFS